MTTHDGFTLEDVASYAERHNEANREGNRDGHAHNLSLNHGQEGPSRDPRILAARARHKRNLLATLFLSQGVPMLLGGDELGRSQGGNNNAYCQGQPRRAGSTGRRAPRGTPDLQAFVANLARLRAELPALRRDTFLTGEPVGPDGLPDVVWLRTDGREMEAADWQDPERRLLGLRNGHDIEGGAVLLWLNAGAEACEVAAPPLPRGGRWRLAFDSTRPRGLVELPEYASSEAGTFTVPPRSTVLLRMTT